MISVICVEQRHMYMVNQINLTPSTISNKNNVTMIIVKKILPECMHVSLARICL